MKKGRAPVQAPIGIVNFRNVQGQQNASAANAGRISPQPASHTEYSDYPQCSTYLKDRAIRRSTSLKREDEAGTVATAQRPPPAGKVFGCTYFGKGFRAGKSQEPAPAREVHRTESKSRLKSMHKTASNWNRPERSVKNGCEQEGRSNSNESFADSRKHNRDYVRSILNAPYGRPDRSPLPADCLPVINLQNSYQLFVAAGKAGDDAEKEDEYFKYINRQKRSRAAAAAMVRSKDGTGRPDRRRLVAQEAKREHEKPPVRAFNWNGIHFEVSKKKDGPIDSARHLRKNYSKEMNLLFYNFNGAQEETHAKSFIEDPPQNKTSMNFYARSEKQREITNSPSSTAAQSNDAGEDAAVSSVKLSSRAREEDSEFPPPPPAKERLCQPLTPITNNSKMRCDSRD